MLLYKVIGELYDRHKRCCEGVCYLEYIRKCENSFTTWALTDRVRLEICTIPTGVKEKEIKSQISKIDHNKIEHFLQVREEDCSLQNVEEMELSVC